MLTSLGRPPRRCCLAGGIMGSTIVHCSSVRSEGYAFRELPSCTIYAHSSPERICANYLPNLFLCQVIFPDSLSVIDGKINHLGRDFFRLTHLPWHDRIARLLRDIDGLALRFQDGLLAGLRPHLNQGGGPSVIIEKDLIGRHTIPLWLLCMT